MNCSEIEELIALYVEGDLDGPGVALVEAHLETCARCQEFADGMPASQAALKGLGRAGIDPAVFVRVRSGVMARVGRPGSLPYWGWLGAAAACVLLVIALYPRVGQVPDLPGGRAGRGPAPLVNIKSVAQIPRRQHATKVRKTPVTVSEPVVIKIITDDPDVVIYWISD